MILAEVHDTTIQVAIVTTVGLIIVAVINRANQKSTSKAKDDASKAKDEAKSQADDASKAKDEAKTQADEASKSADIAKDYAAALGAKDALLQSVIERLEFVEKHDENCTKRLEELERRAIEDEESKRAASLLEREFRELQGEVEKLRQRK